MHILEKAKKFDTWAAYTLLVGVGITLIGFIPMLGMPFGSGKSFLLILSSTVAFLFWLIARCIDGTFIFPESKVFFAYAGLLLAGILSTIFSTQAHESFIGKNLETTTLATLIALIITTFLASVLLRDAKRIRTLYKILVVGFVVVSLFTIVRMITGAGTLTLNVFSSVTETLVGSWIDYALFTAVVTIVSLFALEFLPLPKKKRMFVTAVFAFAMIMSVVTNVALAWVCIGGASLLSFIFLTIINKRTSTETVPSDTSELASPISALVGARNVPFLSLGTFIVSLFFVLTAQSIGASISSALGVSYAEVRPSIAATVGVTTDALQDYPVFGAGLNRFELLWATHKTPDVIGTPYWNVDFAVGSGYIPTHIATGGIVGGLAWIVFSLLLVVLFVKKVFTPMVADQDAKERYVHYVTLLLGIFGFVVLFFYVPGPFMLGLSMLFIALYIGNHVLRDESFATVSILKSNKLAFIGLGLLLVFLLATLYFGFIVVKKQVALAYEARGAVLASRGDVDGSEAAFLRAARMAGDDSVYQALSQLSFARINTLLSTQGLSQETLQAEFKSKFTLAEGYALQAIAYDPSSFRNWVFLGDIYKAFAPLKVNGAYESAQTAYGEAQKIVPSNPLVTLRSADLERANNNTDKARALGRAALDQKANYLEAIFFLSELERSVGNRSEAYALESTAGNIDPNNPELFYQLGLIAYNNGEYTRSVTSFERAVLLNPRFGDARFMLAVAYDKLGRRGDALSVLTALATEIPDNADLQSALARLKSGGSILTGTTQTQVETLDTTDTETTDATQDATETDALTQ